MLLGHIFNIIQDSNSGSIRFIKFSTLSASSAILYHWWSWSILLLSSNFSFNPADQYACYNAIFCCLFPLHINNISKCHILIPHFRKIPHLLHYLTYIFRCPVCDIFPCTVLKIIQHCLDIIISASVSTCIKIQKLQSILIPLRSGVNGGTIRWEIMLILLIFLCRSTVNTLRQNASPSTGVVTMAFMRKSSSTFNSSNVLFV